MKNLLRSSLALLVVTLFVASNAHALAHPPAPEIDPSMATGAFALLMGAVAVIRGRRRA